MSDARLAQLNQEKEAEQKRLEEEMRKRRERIEKWRKEKNKNKPVSWAYFKNKLSNV